MELLRVDFVRIDSNSKASPRSVPIALEGAWVHQAEGLARPGSVVFSCSASRAELSAGGKREDVAGVWIAEVPEHGELIFRFHRARTDTSWYGLVQGIGAFGLSAADGMVARSEVFAVERSALVPIMERPFQPLQSRPDSMALLCGFLVGAEARRGGHDEALDIVAYADGKRQPDATVFGKR